MILGVTAAVGWWCYFCCCYGCCYGWTAFSDAHQNNFVTNWHWLYPYLSNIHIYVYIPFSEFFTTCHVTCRWENRWNGYEISPHMNMVWHIYVWWYVVSTSQMCILNLHRERIFLLLFLSLTHSNDSKASNEGNV